jgi:hypothetical protein
MTCKHVDILAVVILLLGIALFSGTRQAASLVITHKRIVAEPFHRPLVTVPKPPYVTLAVD